MDFLGSHDCPVTEQTLHTVAIKFWYQQPVQTCASLVVFPPDATFSAMHGMMADRGRFRQRWHRDLAYCLPLGLTGKTQNKTAQTTYGSMLQRRIFRGGGPVVLEGSDRLVETMLTKLGFLDTELNADIKEAMFVFVNVSHNKTNLRRIGLLDRAALTVAEASAMLQGAFLSNAGYGWQHAPADCTARNVLLKAGRIKMLDSPRQEVFRAMCQHIDEQGHGSCVWLPSQTYNGLAWSMSHRAAGNTDPKLREIVFIRDDVGK
ncbi:unnamed protein product [Symbiodinium microadriaticum]|nr:unnamed protein product [Symbiodinium microadriaticum]